MSVLVGGLDLLELTVLDAVAWVVGSVIPSVGALVVALVVAVEESLARALVNALVLVVLVVTLLVAAAADFLLFGAMVKRYQAYGCLWPRYSPLVAWLVMLKTCGLKKEHVLLFSPPSLSQ